MDVKGSRGSNSSSSNTSTTTTTTMIQSEEDMDLRRGPWIEDEDLTLINYIANHGEGRWNSLARSAGLKRTGKSCRLRWLNYLRPDVRRGNITLEEQLLILELHARWGNRWSKIAQYLPGRTDNEIKNYWRTRVQKHAKQLKCDVNSKQFKDTMRYLWMPRLVERIQAASAAAAAAATINHNTTTPPTYNYDNNLNNNNNFEVHSGNMMLNTSTPSIMSNNFATSNSHATQSFATPENSSNGTAASSESFGTQDYYSLPVGNGNGNNNNNDNPNLNPNPNPNPDYYNNQQGNQNVMSFLDCITSPSMMFPDQEIDFQPMELPNTPWITQSASSNYFWNDDNTLLQHLSGNM